MEKSSEVCRFLVRRDTLIVYLTCDLDSHTSREVRQNIDSRMFLERPELLVLDFGSVGFMDSSGLALILGRAEVARELGATVKLVGLSPFYKRLVRLGGLDRIANLVISADEYV